MAEARRVTREAGGGLKPREHHRVVVFDSAERLARAAAEAFAEAAGRAVQTRGRFLVALAGGATPRAMYRLLAEDATFRHAVPWPLVHMFWGDERAVGPDHPDSNYRAAHEALLSRVPIPAAQIYRMPADDPDPDRAARTYEHTLRSAFRLADGERPCFDLVLLGMGADGHTASLFPGVAPDEPGRLVLAPYIEKLGTTRLTLTAGVLQAARETLVLVSGADKAATLAAVLTGPSDPRRWPIQHLAGAGGVVTVLADKAAAAALP